MARTIGDGDLRDRISKVEGRQFDQLARIKELESKIRDFQFLAAMAIIWAVALGTNAIFGRENLRELLLMASIVGVGFLFLRGIYRFVTRKPEPSPEP